MAFNPANHFAVSGAGIDGTIDLSSISGEAMVSLTFDGRELRAPGLEITREGIVVRAIHEEVPDSHTLLVTVIIPQVNLDSEPQMGAGLPCSPRREHRSGAPAWCQGQFSCMSCDRWRLPPRLSRVNGRAGKRKSSTGGNSRSCRSLRREVDC
jgi:hypothetical protein